MNKANHVNDERQFLPSFAELIDRLTVDQIKEVLLQNRAEEISKEIKSICNDIDLLVNQNQISLSARLIRIIIILSQMNVHIWNNKDKMKLDPSKYNEHLTLAHQLNGLRNQMKNLLLEESGEKDKNTERTNFDVDGLEGWNISI